MTSRRTIRVRAVGAALLASLSLLLVGEPAVAEPNPPRANLPQLEEEVMCPVCGTLLGLSRAPAAERQRAFIRGLIRKGRNEDQIKAALVAEYGPQVLALPEDEDTDVFVYLVPLLGLIGGAILVLIAAVSWRRKADRELPEVEGPSGPEAERLDRDLDRFGP
ncbi:MAG: cytochrome c-type biogenesis protein CcmH [Solirubrobacterales bacterium]